MSVTSMENLRHRRHSYDNHLDLAIDRMFQSETKGSCNSKNGSDALSVSRASFSMVNLVTTETVINEIKLSVMTSASKMALGSKKGNSGSVTRAGELSQGLTFKTLTSTAIKSGNVSCFNADSSFLFDAAAQAPTKTFTSTTLSTKVPSDKSSCALAGSCQCELRPTSRRCPSGSSRHCVIVRSSFECPQAEPMQFETAVSRPCPTPADPAVQDIAMECPYAPLKSKATSSRLGKSHRLNFAPRRLFFD